MDDRLAEIEARLEAITPGEWRAKDDVILADVPKEDRIDRRLVAVTNVSTRTEADGAFIAAAPEDIRYLVSEVKRLRAVASGISGTEFIIAALQARDRK